MKKETLFVLAAAKNGWVGIIAANQADSWSAIRAERVAARAARDAYFLDLWKKEVQSDFWEDPTEANKNERDRVWDMT